MSNTLAFLAGIAVAVPASLAFAMGLEIIKERRKKQEAKAAQKESADKMDATARELSQLLTSLSTIEDIITSPPVKQPTVQDFLDRAMQITTEQSRIAVNDTTDKLHQYNNLELEKLNLLREVLAHGHDPVITIRYPTGDKKLSLSDYVSSIQKKLH